MTATDLTVVAERRRRLQAWINDHYHGSQAAFIAETGINQESYPDCLSPTASHSARRRPKSWKSRRGCREAI